jgi:hypothetical protein
LQISSQLFDRVLQVRWSWSLRLNNENFYQTSFWKSL